MDDCISAMTAVFDGNADKASALCGQFMPAFDDASGAVDRANQVAIGLNTLYLVSCGALVFVMHAGFAMVGHVKAGREIKPHVTGSSHVVRALPDGSFPFLDRSFAPARFAQRTQVRL